MARRVMELYAREVGPLDELATELGIACDPAALLAGREELASGDLQRLYSGAVARLSTHVQIAEGQPSLRPADWRVVLYGLDGGRTLREAILRASDCFEAIDGRCGLMKLRARGEIAQLRFETLRKQRTATNCLIDLNGIPQMYSQLCWLIDKPIPVIAFALDYPSQVYHSLELPTLPFALNLDEGWSGFLFPSAYLDYPLVRGAADRGVASAPASLSFLGGGETRPETALEHRVRATAMQALRADHRLPPFDEIAARFGGSPVTLRRRLAREGSSYREIRNSCRRELGLDLLRRTELSIEEIAARLDFCDSDAFRSAFREWTQETPSSYRKLVQAETNGRGS